ncbi:MAG TPA: CBS domain-containing protein [Acidimicrobiia bacterium]|jgi:CBS domain-containing protein|nr:CBS domain-containing protein [Acidimicrobiia bacterium]
MRKVRVDMTVRELIGGEIVAVDPHRSLRQAAGLMATSELGALAVTEDRRLIGIFTERDLVRACANRADLDRSTVGDWMTIDPDSLDPDMPIKDAADWMLAAGYRHLPVVEGTTPIGMVSIKDILWGVTGF